jgi:hypothetical protein
VTLTTRDAAVETIAKNVFTEHGNIDQIIARQARRVFERERAIAVHEKKLILELRRL